MELFDAVHHQLEMSIVGKQQGAGPILHAWPHNGTATETMQEELRKMKWNKTLLKPCIFVKHVLTRISHTNSRRNGPQRLAKM